ncbi:MAG: carboxymuconolactone decarboxylase family protein [Aridibacter famidurans]|nr:carboxymuconolactone decarboxylase family protein [Aridibacter famidurans]
MNFKVNTIETAPEGSVETLQNVKKAFGFVPNLIGVFAESPETAEAYMKVSDLFGASSLTATEKQVVLLAASFENKCAYCVAAHTVISDLQKVSKDVVEAVREGRELEDPKLEALRRYTAEITRNRGFASDAAAKGFFDAGYDTKNALEVVLGITQKTLSNYVNHVADTPLDPQFEAAKWDPSLEKAATTS